MEGRFCTFYNSYRESRCLGNFTFCYFLFFTSSLIVILLRNAGAWRDQLRLLKVISIFTRNFRLDTSRRELTRKI